MASSPDSDALAFTISEMTGDARTLVLCERALPYRPIAFSGSQRTKSISYIGNPVKSTQVLGSDEDPFECSGFWKDKYIGDTTGNSPGQSPAYYIHNGKTTQLLTVVDLVNLVDDMRRKGQRVELQWGPQVRRGIIKWFSHKWHNIHDVEWTLRVEVTDQADPDVPAVLARDTDNSQIVGSLLAKVSSFSTRLLDAVGSVESVYLDALNTFVGNVTAIVSEIDNTVSNAVDTVLPIISQQQRLAGLLSSLADACDDIRNTVDEVPATVRLPAFGNTSETTGSTTSSTGSTTPIYVDPTTQTSATVVVGPSEGATEGATLVVEVFNRGMSTDARDMKYTALLAQYDLLKTVNPDIIAVFVAREATDLRDVSTKYYLTQNDWKSLMVFNHFTSSKLSAGDVVFIPRLLRPLDGSQ